MCPRCPEIHHTRVTLPIILVLNGPSIPSCLSYWLSVLLGVAKIDDSPETTGLSLRTIAEMSTVAHHLGGGKSTCDGHHTNEVVHERPTLVVICSGTPKSFVMLCVAWCLSWPNILAKVKPNVLRCQARVHLYSKYGRVCSQSDEHTSHHINHINHINHQAKCIKSAKLFIVGSGLS